MGWTNELCRTKLTRLGGSQHAINDPAGLLNLGICQRGMDKKGKAGFDEFPRNRKPHELT